MIYVSQLNRLVREDITDKLVVKPGGINMYEAQCREKMDGWKGFDVVSAA